MSALDFSWAVRGVDSVLRHRQGIEEYTDDRDCIFRISLARADRDIHLSDGTAIRAADPVVQIHYWNEHMPPIPANGRMTGWASLFIHRVERSLSLLVDRLEREPRFDGVVAINGQPTFPERPGPVALSRACQHLSFDVTTPIQNNGQIHAWLDTLLVSGLIWTFNPGGFHGHGWSRRRIEIWMSRQKLFERYGTGNDDRTARR